MKLAIGLIGAAAAITCPNEGWTLDATEETCIVGSTDYAVDVVCAPTSMTVTFNAMHVYKDLAIPDDFGTVTAHALSDGCATAVTTANGEIVMTIPLDDCGTTVSQSEGKLAFLNTITGDEELIQQTIGSTTVFTTQLLEFDVECTYTDTDTVSVDSIAVESLDVEGEVEGEATFGFTMDAAVNGAAITAENPLVLGELVDFSITPTQVLPSNVQYYVTKCTASGTDDLDQPQSFEVIQDGRCTAAALDTDITDLQSTGENIYKWAMNGFSFSSDGGAVMMSCDIKLCAISDVDGTIDQACHGTATDADLGCANDLGYSFDSDI